MKFIGHIKLALFFGFLVGSLIGMVDIIAKLAVWSFEWFEFYQTLFISIAATVIFFLVLALFAELFKKIRKIEISKERFYKFYITSALAFILLFYGLVLVNVFILRPLSFLDFDSFILSSITFLISILIGVVIFFKGGRFALHIASYLKKTKIKKFIENYLFIIFVFIIISFSMDVYLLNNAPDYSSGESVENKPKIILITLDAVRADHLSIYGYPITTTPNIDKLAENSVVFENAISAALWTLPSITSIFTGRYLYHHNTTRRNQIVNNDELLLAEILASKGYVTSGFISSAYIKSRYNTGQGFMTYGGRLDFLEYSQSFAKFSMRTILDLIPGSRSFIFRSDGERTSDEMNRDVFRFLEKNYDDTFFLYVHYYDAHQPQTLGGSFRNKFTDKKTDIFSVWKLNRDVEIAAMAQRYKPVSNYTIDFAKELYDAEIFYLDYHLGKLFDKLDELGIKNETLIIITADHGEEYYDHGTFKRDMLHEEIIHVPLIISYPLELSPGRIKERVSTINVFSTILDIANIEEPGNIDSVSLVPLIKDKPYNGKYVISEEYGRPEYNESFQQAVYQDQWKLLSIESEDTLNYFLFNLNIDPNENRDFYNINTKKGEFLKKYLIDTTRS